ncbi:STAS/SEC14 domain-containing protein [Fulvivirga lutimaris]|uniref:STAS/SEC14 domain-containing protein n=1 Tax=Fulvivirga lutimaris TaxID=1819566 RepID=UPI0012BC1E11|nr:STAS/SEC14 domain-containing protein [Fulvivirga lutimaris]MTI40884.1 STAS/SEC14 domain-containing protein [Fulvivirga lutimaris]
MIEQIETFEGNSLAIEVIDGFSETDEKLAQKFFNKKIEAGYDHVNVLVKLDEMKISHTSVKAFMEDMIWVIRNFKHLGNLAIVAHSNILKAMVPIDNFFFERLQKGYEERYFDISQMDKAMEFIKPSS